MLKRTLLMLAALGYCLIGGACAPDTDGDGVEDRLDSCRNTPICATVDATGCPSDTDDDGVYDGCDECPNTPADTQVYGNGCAAEGPTGGVPPACIGPDPRAKSIDYSLVNLTDSTTATIEIKGTVDNVGSSNYDSGADQQAVVLFEDDIEVAREEFEDLAVGAEVTVKYQRTWSLQGAEFQPTRYKVTVSYDPDILDDGNTANDDCNLDNNSLLRGVDGIATLFE